jgi:hypothetical protein
VDALVAAVKFHNRLQHLSLQSCRLTDHGMTALACLSTLRSLLLAHNYLGDVGALALAATLRSLALLEVLDVRDCSIEREGAAALLPAAAGLPRLQRLGLAANHIMCVRALGPLRRLHTLVHLDLSRVWPAFLAGTHEQCQEADAHALVTTLAHMAEGATIDLRACAFTMAARSMLDAAHLPGRRRFLLGCMLPGVTPQGCTCC